MDLYIYLFEIVGTIAFALSGAVEGIKHDLDAFGIIICGIVTATGGGIIRDVIIGHLPPNALKDSTFVLIAICTAVIIFLIAKKYKNAFLDTLQKNRIVNLADNIGLATFTIISIQRCLPEFSSNISVLIFVGVITGTGGGVLRDLFTNTIPVIFRKRVYAVASLIGAIFYLSTYNFLGQTISSFVAMAIIVAIRVCSSKYNWDIPKVNLD